MAAADTYYIDTINFADANEVFLDEALTTCAPNGFYQMGGATAREQVDCVNGVGGRLLDPVACPSCTPPAVDPPIAANTSYKVTDVVTSAIAFVAITNTYQPTQKITTNLSTNCWLINNGSTDTVTATITGPCNPQFVEQPLYFLLNPCPNSVPPSSEYTFTYIVDPSNNKPPANGRYLDPTTGQFYTSANTTNPIGSAIPLSGSNNLYNSEINENLTLVGSFPTDPVNLGCPPPPEVFCYWNATPCSGGAQVIIKTPANVFDSIAQGTSSVKVSGTCYTINDLSLCTSDVVANIGLYDGTIYTACQLGTNPCIPPPAIVTQFKVRETTTNVIKYVLDDINFSIGDIVNTTIDSGCWIIEAAVTGQPATSNAITQTCQVVSACTTYTATTLSTGTLTCNQCYDGAVVTVNATQNSPAVWCCITDTASAGGAATLNTAAGCEQPNDPSPTPKFYLIVKPCGGNTTQIANTFNNQIDAGWSVKLNSGSTCYEVVERTTTVNNTLSITSSYINGCNACAPPANCSPINLQYSQNTACEGPIQFIFGDTADLSTATKLYATENGCSSGDYAERGYYTQPTGASTGITRYWDAPSFGAQSDCGTAPQNSAELRINYDNVSGGSAGVAYDMVGDSSGAKKYFDAGTTFDENNADWFNTSVDVSPGWTGTGVSVTYTPNSITATSIVTAYVNGTFSPVPTTYAYSIQNCSTSQVWNVDSNTTLSNGDVVTATLDWGQVVCGTVIGSVVAGTSVVGNFLDFINGDCTATACVALNQKSGGKGTNVQ